MKTVFLLGCCTLLLSGCAAIPHYRTSVQLSPPESLSGNWQTVGAQSGLVSPEAKAMLIITPDGATLDCRQWQRVLVKRGKVTLINEQWSNINQDDRVMPLQLQDDELRYDKLVLRKVPQADPRCLAAEPSKPRVTSQPVSAQSRHHKAGPRNTKG